MNTLQDVREAQQMWVYKFKNTGRESIVLRNVKSGWLASVLSRITSYITVSTSKGGKTGVRTNLQGTTT